MFFERSPIRSSSDDIFIAETVSLKSIANGWRKAIRSITCASIFFSNSSTLSSFPIILSTKS